MPYEFQKSMDPEINNNKISFTLQRAIITNFILLL